MYRMRLLVLALLSLTAVLPVLAEEVPSDDQAERFASRPFVSEGRPPTRGMTLLIPLHVNYQGYLEDDSGNPITDTLGMVFSIHTSSTGGTELWNESHSVPVEKGIFNVILGTSTPIPNDVFTPGESRWFELVVETQTLSPRTEITSVGYAYRSVSADSASYASDCDRVDNHDASATPTANDLFPLSFGDAQYVNEGQPDAVTGSMILNGTVARTDVEPAFKAPYADTADYALSAPSFPDNDWAIGFNVLYPSDNYGLLMRGNNAHYGTEDSTHVNLGTACTTGTMGQNYDHCTVAGGMYNAATGLRSAVGGGLMNQAAGSYSTTAGGEANTAGGDYTTVAGGSQNTAGAAYGSLCGGESNTVSGSRGFLGGGYSNRAGGNYSVTGGGQNNAALGGYSSVCGGYSDTVSAFYGGVLAGCVNVAGDAVTDTAAVVLGGWGNRATGKYSMVGGGANNLASGEYAAVAGGDRNAARFTGTTVSGGQGNNAIGYMSTIGGGASDTVNGDYSFAAGRQVTVTSTADYTLAFGRNFTTTTPNAVILHNSVDSIRVGIGNIAPTHLLDVGQTGAYCNGTVWMDGSSREYKENVIDLTLQEALAVVSDLDPVKFTFKTDPNEEYLGFIAEDVPELVATKDRRSLSSMDIVAALAKVVQYQQEQIELLRAEVEGFRSSLD